MRHPQKTDVLLLLLVSSLFLNLALLLGRRPTTYWGLAVIFITGLLLGFSFVELVKSIPRGPNEKKITAARPIYGATCEPGKHALLPRLRCQCGLIHATVIGRDGFSFTIDSIPPATSVQLICALDPTPTDPGRRPS